MDRVLIIRSVSLQQLDKNLPAIRERFADSELHLLTHPHSVDLCRKYTSVARVLSTETPQGFSPWRRPRRLPARRYAAVLVPVSNRSGAGFLNVLLLAARLRPRSVFLCDLASAIRPVSLAEILRRTLQAAACSTLALLGSAPVLLLAFPWLLFCLLFFRGKRSPADSAGNNRAPVQSRVPPPGTEPGQSGPPGGNPPGSRR